MSNIMGNQQIQQMFLAMIEKLETQDRLINAILYYVDDKVSAAEKQRTKKLLEDVKNLNKVNTYKVKDVIGM